jgi:hypothetical protein
MPTMYEIIMSLYTNRFSSNYLENSLKTFIKHVYATDDNRKKVVRFEIVISCILDL